MFATESKYAASRELSYGVVDVGAGITSHRLNLSGSVPTTDEADHVISLQPAFAFGEVGRELRAVLLQPVLPANGTRREHLAPRLRHRVDQIAKAIRREL